METTLTDRNKPEIKCPSYSASEGAMIKSLRGDYPLTGMTNLMVKFKKEADIDAKVISVHRVKGEKVRNIEAWNYLCAIRDIKGNLIPIGNTYNVGFRVPEGGIIRVAFVNLNRYTDPKTGRIWFNWWAPRAIEYREDKKEPDNTEFAEGLVQETHGEIEEKPFPTRYKFLKEEEELADPFLIIPAKRMNKYSIHAHIRGRSVHLDNRRQISSDYAVGVTHFIERGLSKEPQNFQEAKELYYKEIHPLVLKHIQDPTQKLLSSKKALIPIEWLDIEGKVEKGEVGATRFEYGYFIIVEKGEYEALTLKPYFHEYQYYGKVFKRKYIDRLIENRKEWKKVGDETYSWMFFKTENPPYVITKRAVEKGWIPPKEYSALPLELEKKVPSHFRYWEKDSEAERIKIRNLLFEELIKKHKLELQKELKLPIDAKLTLWYRWWKGPKVIRFGPSKEIWDLFIEYPQPLNYIAHFELEYNPLITDSTSGVERPLVKDGKVLGSQGSIKPGTPFLNPTKATPCTIERLEYQAPISISIFSENLIKMKINGKKLKGLFLLKREEPKSNIWTFERTQLKPETIRAHESLTVSDGEGNPFAELTSVSEIPNDDGTSFLLLEGMALRPGIIKGRTFLADTLRTATLRPKPGFNLCYINYRHHKEEIARVGVLFDIFWNENKEWLCKLDKKVHKGALMFRGLVSDKDAIQDILERKGYLVSSEISWEQDPNVESNKTDLILTGMALLEDPACPECRTEKVCPEHKECIVKPLA